MKEIKEKGKLNQILDEAYSQYERGLLAYACYKVNNSALGEDLVQDTFMKTWNFLANGGKVGSMKAFLFHVLNNLIVDQYRKQKTISLDQLIEKGFEPSEGSPKLVDNVLSEEEMLPLIEHLPKKYKKVMRMRYLQDLSLKEMSDITQDSKNTISVQIHRGIKKLRLLCPLPV